MSILSPAITQTMVDFQREVSRTSAISTTPREPRSVLPNAIEKSAPDALHEELSHPSAKAGATILISDEVNKADIKFITNRFYLTNLQISFREKAQLIETFGPSSISFFGDSIRVYNLSGIAVDYPSNTPTPYESMHQSSLLQLYDTELRGTILVQKRHIAILKVMNHLIYGYPLNFNINYSANHHKTANFTTSWIISKHSLYWPGIFTDRELSNLYSRGWIPRNEDEHTVRARRRIQEFLDFYKTNMIINVDSSERDSQIFKIRVTDLIPKYAPEPTPEGFSESHSVGPLTLISELRRITGSEERLRELKSEIQDGIINMIEYMERGGGTSIAIEMFTTQSLKQAKNSVNTMFESPEHLGNVAEFLLSVKAIEAKLFMTKLFL